MGIVRTAAHQLVLDLPGNGLRHAGAAAGFVAGEALLALGQVLHGAEPDERRQVLHWNSPRIFTSQHACPPHSDLSETAPCCEPLSRSCQTRTFMLCIIPDRLRKVRKQETLCAAQAHTGTGIRHHQVRAGLPSVLAARDRPRAGRAKPCNHGLEHEAVFVLRPA